MSSFGTNLPREIPERSDMAEEIRKEAAENGENDAVKTGEGAKKPEKSEKAEKNETKALRDKIKTMEADAEKAKKEAEEKLSEANDKYLRMMAEYDNYRRRSKAEKDAAYTDAYADALKTLLPIFDNLKRAETFAESEKLAEGVRMTMAQYNDALKLMGVEEYGAVGEQFDPNLHNAVMQTEQEGVAENTIVQVLQQGYKRGDRIVRCATVIVSA